MAGRCCAVIDVCHCVKSLGCSEVDAGVSIELLQAACNRPSAGSVSERPNSRSRIELFGPEISFNKISLAALAGEAWAMALGCVPAFDASCLGISPSMTETSTVSPTDPVWNAIWRPSGLMVKSRKSDWESFSITDCPESIAVDQIAVWVGPFFSLFGVSFV